MEIKKENNILEVLTDDTSYYKIKINYANHKNWLTIDDFYIDLGVMKFNDNSFELALDIDNECATWKWNLCDGVRVLDILKFNNIFYYRGGLDGKIRKRLVSEQKTIIDYIQNDKWDKWFRHVYYYNFEPGFYNFSPNTKDTSLFDVGYIYFKKLIKQD
jgi:hypothetical protein